jgi:6,7-dimethyl-8-ribityllumazine synthase
MSGAGQPKLEKLDGSDLKVAIVASSWHETVMEGLVAGAERALVEAHVVSSSVVRTPGSFELPVVALALARRDYDAVVALGVVVRGGTPHFDYVCDAVTAGLTSVAVETGVPIGFGVLTCDNDQQALDRAGLEGSKEDKGYEATHAAMSTALLLRDIKNRG